MILCAVCGAKLTGPKVRYIRTEKGIRIVCPADDTALAARKVLVKKERQ